MAIAYSCILIVILLPYCWVYFAKFGKMADGSKYRYDNATPRVQQATLNGIAARGLWAHNNAFEAQAAFVAAVLVAAQAGVPAETINIAAMVFVAVRVLHGVFYLANLGMLRSTAWALGLLTVVYLFVEAIRLH